VARGLDWLLDQQDYDSGLVGEKFGNRYLYGHAIATIALCEAVATSQNPVLRDAAQRAVNFATRARNPYGAWRYDSPPVGDNDTSVTTWMVCALQAAVWSGLSVDEAARRDALGYLDEATDRATGRVGYTTGRPVDCRYEGVNDSYPYEKTEAMTAGGLLARLLLGQRAEDAPILEKHAQVLLRAQPEWGADGHSNDMGYWYFGSAAMHQMGGRSWEAWRKALRAALRRSQRTRGTRAGSWDPNGPWGWSGGRVYATAMGALALEAGWRLEPLVARK
jgi:hypothetical protein